MTKLILFILASFTATYFYSQNKEELAPLYTNSKLNAQENLQKEGLIHTKYIYLFDTITLPFIDDFTTNKFKKFDAKTTDANVTDTTWFLLESAGIAFPMGTVFSLDSTFLYEYDTVVGRGFDSIILVNKTPLTSQFITLFDIDNYPVTFDLVEVWPNYNQYDSLWTGSSPDLTFAALSNIVEQDSATVYFVFPTAQDAAILWKDDNVYHNYTYAKNPETLGIASFDGLNRNGYPYNFQSVSAKGLADVLTSKPIDLSSVIIDDSLSLSFLYQRGGHGESPDATDSLVLEFWSPINNQWNSIWKATGGPAEAVFNFKMQKITDAQYFQNGFQFRFKSYGSQTGSLDVWHLDYVILKKFRLSDDTLINDWAFVEPAPSLLQNYTSMPWPHYEFSPYNTLKTSTTVKAFNSAITDINVGPNPMTSMNLFFDNTLLQNVPYVAVNFNALSRSVFNINYNLPTNFWFDTILADTCATFDLVYTTGTTTTQTGDLSVNDTLVHHQHFSNYYSYDDGTAEAAYGLVQAGAELANKFTIPSGLTDTLRAISIHFSPSVNDVSNELFFLQVWGDNNGQPGNLIYTSDDDFFPIIFKPKYTTSNNGFYEYILPEKLLVSGTFYVGWKQSSAQRLNIGFDKNTNTQDKIFYKTSSLWSTTGFQGSLMMRPVFSSDKDYVMGLLNRQEATRFDVSVYPSPTSESITITTDVLFKGSLELISLQGQLLYNASFNSNQVIDVSDFPNGIYFVRLIHENGSVQTSKFSVLK